MKEQELIGIVDTLVSYPKESEWIEFKVNNSKPEEIGKRISALANGACIRKQRYGYLVYGIEDGTKNIVGTKFKPLSAKNGNEELESWLLQMLSPRIDFQVYEFNYSTGERLALFMIPAAKNEPVRFQGEAYIRVGSTTRKLKEYPEKERKIWAKEILPFEKRIAHDGLQAADVIQMLNTNSYFDLLGLPYPSDVSGVVERFLEDGLLVASNGLAITNLGALLFAKDLNKFESVKRKAVRVIVYKGTNKLETIREQPGIRGYAVGFDGLMTWINGQLPANEIIGKALRQDKRMYPQLALRELVANALIHQDLDEKGFPMIEIFSDRIEISNAGVPLISPERFIDEYQSRNEQLADMMRRLGFCEEKGSGLDKVIAQNEIFQLPPISVDTGEKRTRISMYSYRPLSKLDKNEKIRACYQHACLKYVSNERMTNATLRERFKISDKNSALASRIIRDTIKKKLSKPSDPSSSSKKHISYVPFWG